MFLRTAQLVLFVSHSEWQSTKLNFTETDMTEPEALVTNAANREKTSTTCVYVWECMSEWVIHPICDVEIHRNTSLSAFLFPSSVLNHHPPLGVYWQGTTTERARSRLEMMYNTVHRSTECVWPLAKYVHFIHHFTSIGATKIMRYLTFFRH